MHTSLQCVVFAYVCVRAIVFIYIIGICLSSFFSHFCLTLFFRYLWCIYSSSGELFFGRVRVLEPNKSSKYLKIDHHKIFPDPLANETGDGNAGPEAGQGHSQQNPHPPNLQIPIFHRRTEATAHGLLSSPTFPCSGSALNRACCFPRMFSLSARGTAGWGLHSSCFLFPQPHSGTGVDRRGPEKTHGKAEAISLG